MRRFGVRKVFFRNSTANACLIRIMHIEFATPNLVSPSLLTNSRVFGSPMGFAATLDRHKLNSDRSDLKSPETKH